MNSNCFRKSKCMTAPSMFNSKRKTKKSLLCAVMAGVVACGGAASAATLDEVDLSQIPLDKPTLDYLHENKVTMPPELDADGNVVDGTDNIIYPESGYTLKEVENADSENLPENTITKYELTDVTKYYYPETGAEVAPDALESGVDYKQVTVPQETLKYYTVGLKQTEYGTKEGATGVKYFNWGADINGTPTLTEGLSPLGTNDITYYVNEGSFVDNHKTSPYGNSALGGAIDNYRDTGIIIANFVNNHIVTTGGVGILDDSERAYLSSGGAISNNSTSAVIEGINGNFIGNYVSTNVTAFGQMVDYYSLRFFSGGAINNIGIIGDITGDFIDNYVKLETSVNNGWISVSGGAINNNAQVYITPNKLTSIGNITGSFIRNHVLSTNTYSAYGGAIYNKCSTIGEITGDFIENYVQSTSGPVYGGAIYNYSGTIGNITGDFIGNYIQGSLASGGAIYNYSGTIGNITGDFISNYVKAPNGSAYGGAIYNYVDPSSVAQIGDITGDFIGNYTSGSSAYGGAIYNTTYGSSSNIATFVEITGNFIGNYAEGLDSAHGGAIYNTGTIANITGDFIGNYAQGASYANGGAIYNVYRSTGNITGDFISNYVKAPNGSAYGGAMYTELGLRERATIEYLHGNFISNYVLAKTDAYGGALYYNVAYHSAPYNGNLTIYDVQGDFVNNYAKATNGSAYGGAIYTEGNVLCSYLIGDFVNNSAIAKNNAYGGAVYGKYSHLTNNIYGNIDYNHAIAETGNASGGAIYSLLSVGSISGNIIGNYAESKLGSAYGGALYIFDYSPKINGDIIGNYVSGYNEAKGGAIYGNNYTLTITNSNIIGNFARSKNGVAQGGAIYFDSGLNVISDNINEFITDNYLNLVSDNYKMLVSDNYVQSGSIKDNQAIYMANGMSQLSLRAINNGSIVVNDKISGNNCIFINRASTLLSETMDSDKEIFITVNKNTYTDAISGNNLFEYYEEIISPFRFGEEIYTYYYYNEKGEKVKIETSDIPKIEEQYLDYSKVTPKAYSVNIDGDETGYIQLNNNIEVDNPENLEGGVDISLSNVTLHLGARDNVLDGNNLTLNSGTLNMINNQVGVSALNSLTVNGDTNFVADVDLANQTMDRFTANSYGEHQGNLNVIGMNVLSDMTPGIETLDILFAEKGLKDNVRYNGGELPHENYQTSVYTPIYKYNIIYDNREDAGYFTLAKGDKIFIPAPDSGATGGKPIIKPTGNPSDAFNPSVLGSPVAAQTGAMATVGQAFNYAFQNSDNFMTIPYLERVAMKNANRYALSPTGDATDVGTFSPLFTKQDTSSAWVKPYATFENVPLKNGPKVSNITYGTLIGFDGEMQHLKRGWDRVWTGYIGYNGASQRYSGVDSTQNGGLLGTTMTMYKGNFFNATTLSVGASLAENTNMYGKEDFTMLLGGIANKTGYNFEYKGGKLILQPSMLLSYTFVNTFDYTNAAGVRIDTKPLHAIQLAPGVKIIGNLEGGWQPYASVNMVWNLMGKSDATANGVKLPEMSIKPYVQYGVGVQKRIKDRAMAYGQAMIQNGGRNGISLSGGFRWALGREGKPIEKVNKSDKKIATKKIIPVFEMENGEKIRIKTDNGFLRSAKNSKNAVQGAERKIIKQMSSLQKTKYLSRNTTITPRIGVITR